MAKKIAVVGGTGDIGEGFSLRFAAKGHDVLVGSREKEKAEVAADEYKKKIKEQCKIEASVRGLPNADAVKEADFVVLAIPYEHLQKTLDAIDAKYFEEKVVISPIVPMKKEAGVFEYTRPAIGSAAEDVQSRLPKSKVVSAYHNVPAKSLADCGKPLENYDVIMCGNDDGAKEIVAGLIREMGARPYNAGPLKVSCMIEPITPLLINTAKFSKSEKPLSIKLV